MCASPCMWPTEDCQKTKGKNSENVEIGKVSVSYFYNISRVGPSDFTGFVFHTNRYNNLLK